VTHILAFSLTWEPQLHGILVVTLAVVLLPGTVYLLLATNLGSRLGFLIAIAGLFGWMSIMGIVWTVYGIGLKGTANAWVVKTVVPGDIAASSNLVLDGFPTGWHKLATDVPEVADASTAADPALAPPADTGKQGIYTSSSDYLAVAAYDKGGEKYLPGWSHPPEFIAFKHKPHYFVLQVQKVKKQTTVPGQPPPKAVTDPSQPVTSVLMVRDLGSLRRPPAVVATTSLILFGVTCYVLHRRDKEAWAKRSTALEPVGRD
jgi:hypothetical protein